MTTLLIALCGGAGAVTRFVVDAEVRRRVRGSFPVGTFLINVVGSFLLGVLTGALTHHAGWLSPTAKVALGTGFCGGFTTFSTASVETTRLWLTTGRTESSRYAVATVAVSLLAAFLGLALGAALS
ncbi:MAG TPA: fluoride efflux transporter CrcB [Flexivirga sp.]|uniref:fluoride efflux transporter CrcB n=1 Tax=Flexivirga sp. TaxID=1962927 RepID=UPI002CCD49DD|nr:fluoride efflux transporter CrcB [Flexivirga sp.]HWC21119.1 fluoride efflux transporter CrcB [Flexivirga sp.]